MAPGLLQPSSQLDVAPADAHGERCGASTQPGLEGRGCLCGVPQPMLAFPGAGTHQGR